MIKFDFTINLAKDRADYIRKEISKEKNKLSPKNLEQIGNYILFGKDDNGTSAVDRKEIEISTKYGSYKKRKVESLDALLESPTFDEGTVLQPGQKSVVKIPKPTFKREDEADIPGIKGLWEAIDRIDRKLKVYKGEVAPEANEKVIDSVAAYNLKHLLIELRREQYTYRDIFKPPINTHGPSKKFGGKTFIDWNGENSPYKVLPLGLYNKNWGYTKKGKVKGIVENAVPEKTNYSFDFTNPDHIYHILELYEDLQAYCEHNVEAPLTDLLNTLDFFIEEAKFDEVRTLIIEKKIKKWSNLEIAAKLEKSYNKKYSTNYISTIFKKEICGKIASSAQLFYDKWINRDNNEAWKMCSSCGKLLLKDSREFSKKARSKDGFNTFCKACEKEKRLKRK